MLLSLALAMTGTLGDYIHNILRLIVNTCNLSQDDNEWIYTSINTYNDACNSCNLQANKYVPAQQLIPLVIPVRLLEIRMQQTTSKTTQQDRNTLAAIPMLQQQTQQHHDEQFIWVAMAMTGAITKEAAQEHENEYNRATTQCTNTITNPNPYIDDVANEES